MLSLILLPPLFLLPQHASAVWAEDAAEELGVESDTALRSYRPNQHGLYRPEPDLLGGLQADIANGGASDEKVVDSLKKFWGSKRWPPAGVELRPPAAGGPQPAAPWSARLLGLMLLAVAAMGIGLYSSAKIQVQPLKERKFAMHLHALSSSIVWRHLHRRAFLFHFARVAIPALILFLLHKGRGLLEQQVKASDARGIIEVAGGTPQDVVDAVVETALATSFVYIAMMSMIFFVWHVGAESESGFRHLLHASGLSRPAYILATAGIDGIGLAFLGLLVMVLVAGGLLAVRMVLWTSPVVLLVALAVLSNSAVMMGYIVHFVCPSARLGSMVAQGVMVLVVCIAPFAPVNDVVPLPGQQSWKVMFLPTIPAYRATFELVAGCAKGRCLGLDDLGRALSGPNWAGPWRLLVGSAAAPEMTPPEAMISFTLLALFQLAVGWSAVVLLDRHFHPTLHDSGAQGMGRSTRQGVVLEVSGLVHWYGWLQNVRTTPAQKVLNGVSFSLSPGAMLGMLGPNGAGKTTVIRCITGEERPIKGTVAISIDPAAGGAYIGLCPQETVVNNDLTVGENLLFFARLRGAHGKEACVESSLVATQLENKRDALPGTLSGGMRRRLAVGCAMIASPSVAILDEPTTGLDPMNRRSLWDSINSIRSNGACCLLTTHMLEEAEALCSYIVVMSKGSVAAEGSVQQLKQAWGTGYMLSIDSVRGQEEKAKDFIKSLLPEEDQLPIASKTDGQFTFKFSRGEEALGNAIIQMAREKGDRGIRHWGISQASLEDAYVRIIQQSTDALV